MKNLTFSLNTPHYTIEIVENSTTNPIRNFDQITPGALYGSFGFEKNKFINLHTIDHLPYQPRKLINNTTINLPPVINRQLVPDDFTYQNILAKLITKLSNKPPGNLQKLVLARKQILYFNKPLIPEHIINNLLIKYPHSNIFLQKNIADDSFIFGATPELVISKRGNEIQAYPLAGTCPRGKTLEQDKAQAKALLASSKDQQEHRYLVEHYRQILTSLCTELMIPNHPSLVKTKYTWHLGTPIQGKLKTKITSIQLAWQLHPTPAIGGFPATNISKYLAEYEDYSRRYYAGNLGWQNSQGDGDWFLNIRSGEYFWKDNTLHSWAGGGIIASSNPVDELAETHLKFQTIKQLFR